MDFFFFGSVVRKIYSSPTNAGRIKKRENLKSEISEKFGKKKKFEEIFALVEIFEKDPMNIELCGNDCADNDHRTFSFTKILVKF